MISGQPSQHSEPSAADNSLSSLNSQPLQYPRIDQAAYYGLAGEIVEAIEPFTEADPVAILVNSLTAFGNIIGRGPHFLVEKSEHHLNLFVVQVGKSAKGRKGIAWSTPKYMFKAVDSDWAEKRVKGGLSSGEGLVYAVRDQRIEKKPYRKGGELLVMKTRSLTQVKLTNACCALKRSLRKRSKS